MVVPLHVKWMLVWVDPNVGSGGTAPGPGGGRIVLCRGAPRAWFEHGEVVSVARAPVVGGRISFEVVSNLGAAVPTIRANVSMAPSATASQPAAAVSGSGSGHSAGHRMGNPGAQGRGRSTGLAPVTLTLRAPTGWVLRSVMMDGQAWPTGRFDPVRETIELPALLPEGVALQATYAKSDMT